jgi:very-short-patch-repair endonuclease
MDYQSAIVKFEKNQDLGQKLFLQEWKGTESDWQKIEIIKDWLQLLYEGIQKEEFSANFPHLLKNLKNIDQIVVQRKILAAITKKVLISLADLNSFLKIKEGKNLENFPIENLEHLICEMGRNVEEIFSMPKYNKISADLEEKGLSQISTLAFDWKYPPLILKNLFYYNWYKTLVNKAYQDFDAIKHFDQASHVKDIKEFAELDKGLFYFSQEKLITTHYHHLPSMNSGGEMAVIRREINKKRRHIPLRQLLAKAGNAVQQIKPVFMMSPMSVATFLAPGTLEFDLVIFDEASQVKVVDALIPILRGKQIVVVGDSKQMPPTDFFSRTFEDEEETMTGDIESILSMFLAQGANESMLKWHYRSRHDSLINVSNQEFYDGRLMIFPSSGTNPDATGLKFNHIPNSVYERGTSRTNPYEARVVATAVMNHAKEKPYLTLGVVAFSTAQRDCILLELERLRRENPNQERFFQSQNLEEFFVKNLENVQGDERDVIFISIGYGLTAERNLPQNFGPVNREGGERRLNVLITRARLAMEVFCNFTADDLETNSSSPFGVRALKSFLKYAEKGHLENRYETGKETDSPFEDQVIRAIRNLGYDVEPQVGSAGFFIDIAVKDPQQPGKYILAVECDGASYHSTVSARDRDRLRQSVLEGMGWRFHRIWSTDWFRTESKQIKLLQEVIQNAVSTSEAEQKVKTHSIFSEKFKINPIVIEREIEEKKEPERKKYQVIDSELGVETFGDILMVPTRVLSNAVLNILQIEGPIHLREAARRITDSMSIGRIGNRIFDHIRAAAKEGHSKKIFFLQNDFLYLDEQKEVDIRDRSELSITSKKIEFVPPEEIQKAIIQTIDMSFSISENEVISETLKKIGFGRATQNASRIVKSDIKKLIHSNKIKMEQERLILFQN